MDVLMHIPMRFNLSRLAHVNRAIVFGGLGVSERLMGGR